MRQRALIGLASMGNAAATLIPSASFDNAETNDTLGATVGVGTVTLTVSQMPPHDHGGVTGSDGSHSHTYNDQNSIVGISQGNFYNIPVNPQTSNTSTIPPHTHSIASQGGGTAHINVQPSLAATCYIKL